MPCVVPEMLWSLDELKRALISGFPILETEEGEGFKILLDLFVEWAEILLNYNNQHPLCWIWGIVARNPSLRGFPAAHIHVALGGCHRTPEDSIALHTHTHRSSYSTKGIVYQKNLRIRQITILEEKMNLKRFFFLASPFGGKILWNMIIWNMGESWSFQRFEESRKQSYSIKLWYFRPVEAMEILGCGVSRAGWSVMLCGYMEWNLWPQFDQKRCQHVLENPTCRTGNAYQGGIVLQGWHPTQCNCIKWKYGTFWARGSSLIQTWPSLGMRKLNRQPSASKNKLNSSSTGFKDSRVKLMTDERNKTLRLFKISLLEKLWAQRILTGLNMCDWTWQHVTREKVRLTRVTQPHSHHQRSFIIFRMSGVILAWNMNSFGIWVRFC